MGREQIKMIFSRITGEFLYPLLNSRGFRPRGRDKHVLVEGDSEYLVRAWLQYPARSEVAAIHVSAAVAQRRLWQFLRTCAVFKETSMYAVTGCGGLIRSMFPRSLSPSWDLIDENADPVSLGHEMIGQFQQYVFPYLDHFSHFENALEYWAGSGRFSPMARVAALLLRGERNKGFGELDDLTKMAMAEYQETQKPGDAEQVAELRCFRVFLESADTSKFQNKAAT
jgi:hypothetical protein